jgi:hypothetical protein
MEEETKKIIDKALFDKKTLDQIAKIILLRGTPEQQKEVLEYVKKVSK